LKQAYSGITIPVEIEKCVEEGDLKINEMETLNINIPQGIDDGEGILLQGTGNVLIFNGKKICGDVKLVVKVTNDNAELTRNGIDLCYKKKITLKEALCGFKFKFEHINNKSIGLNVNIVLYTGAKQVIKNMGMIRDGNTGNLILDFEVVFPESLTQEQKEALLTIL
jgi:DnaJ family protein B protein 4